MSSANGRGGSVKILRQVFKADPEVNLETAAIMRDILAADRDDFAFVKRSGTCLIRNLRPASRSDFQQIRLPIRSISPGLGMQPGFSATALSAPLPASQLH